MYLKSKHSLKLRIGSSNNFFKKCNPTSYIVSDEGILYDVFRVVLVVIL
jgi:hypothetical protein